jgi:hypothetical protein
VIVEFVDENIFDFARSNGHSSGVSQLRGTNHDRAGGEDFASRLAL